MIVINNHRSFMPPSPVCLTNFGKGPYKVSATYNIWHGIPIMIILKKSCKSKHFLCFFIFRLDITTEMSLLVSQFYEKFVIVLEALSVRIHTHPCQRIIALPPHSHTQPILSPHSLSLSSHSLTLAETTPAANAILAYHSLRITGDREQHGD